LPGLWTNQKRREEKRGGKRREEKRGEERREE
jgi:hypothetical protein